MGTRVGEWPVQLLSTPDFELSQRVAILSDTDHRDPDKPVPGNPVWQQSYSEDKVRRFSSHPTLEPSLAAGNETLMHESLVACGIEPPTQIDLESVDELFRKKRRKKAEFALEFAAQVRETDSSVIVPPEIEEMFQFLTEERRDGPNDDVAEDEDSRPD